MRVLVGCEYSGRVAAAFRARGHRAYSCDLLPCEDPEGERFHFQGDVFEAIDLIKPDLAVFHPPCTHLASSGARWLTDHFVVKRDGPDVHEGQRGYWHDGTAKRAAQRDALEFVLRLWNAPVLKVAIENPVGMLSSLWRPADQYIQPWEHGHGETKKTGLWLRGLPLLKPSNVVSGREGRIWKLPPGEDRWKERSRTFEGIARAMAAQWG